MAASQVPGAVALRLAGLYGPGRTQLLQRLREGQARAAAGHWANRIHIDDAAAAVDHLLHLPAPCLLSRGRRHAHATGPALRRLARMLQAPPPAPGPAPANVGSKRMSNRRLKDSGLALRWPDSLAGYRELIERGMV